MTSLTRAAMGWQPLDAKAHRILAENPRCILIYPHTSFYDFLLYLIYSLEDPVLHRRSRVLINPHFTERFQWILKYVGSIESTRREIRQGGATARILEALTPMDEFIFLISPKGSMEAYHEWRTGFYHLAKQLQVPIITAGFDYQKKCFIMNEPFWVNDLSFEEACQIAKAKLRPIMPRHPYLCEYPIDDDYDLEELSLVDPWHQTLIFVIVVLILILIFVVIVWVWLRWQGPSSACRCQRPMPWPAGCAAKFSFDAGGT